MRYKIVVDSCCELPAELLRDRRFERVPLGLEVGDYSILDDEHFDQAEFLRKRGRIPQMSQILLSVSGAIYGELLPGS